MRAFRQRFDSLKDQYDTMKKRAADATVKSRWATDDMLDQRPFSKELGWESGEWLDAEPRGPSCLHRYDLDTKGRPAAMLYFPSEGEPYETFYLRERGEELTATFVMDEFDEPPLRKLEVIESFQLTDEGVVCHEKLNFLGGPSGDYERYEYKRRDGLIHEVREYWHYPGDWWPTRWEVRHDSAGRVRRIEQVDGGCDIRPNPLIYARGLQPITRLRCGLVALKNIAFSFGN